MKLKEYAANINALLSNRPETAEFEVVAASDDEGNGYNLVHYDPTVGNWDSEEREFVAQEEEVNAVCIN